MVKTQDEPKEVFLRMAQATNHFLNLSIENLGFVLYDENLPAAVKKQKLLAELNPHSPALDCLREIAIKLCKPAQEQEDHDGIINFFN
jgi:flagellar biosynthesis protein FlhG